MAANRHEGLKEFEALLPCDGRMSRRQFIGSMCAIGLCTAASSLHPFSKAFSGEALPEGLKRQSLKPSPTINAVFVRLPTPWWMGWPGAAYPVEQRESELTIEFRNIAKEIGVNLFVEPKFIPNADEAKALIERLKADPPDAFLVVLHHIYLWDLVKLFVGTGIRTIIYSPVGTSFIGPMHAYSGQPKVWYVSSIDLEGIRRAFKAIKAGKLMSNSRLAIIRGDKEETTKVELVGTEVVVVPVKRYVEEFNKVSPDDKLVRELASRYKRTARKIVEPKEEDIIHAARTYFAHRNIMAAYDADAVATDCLPLVANRQVPPPCLAFTHLRDEGFQAGCEADRDATLTLMLCQYLLDRPGFMGNPVPDTVRQTLITSHCTCPLRLTSFYDEPAEFVLRSHSESNTGVAMQVLWRAKRRATVLRFLGPGNLMFGTGTVVENIDTPPWGGCRTSVSVKLDDVIDVRRLRGFHHQVLVRGEHNELLECYAQLHGIARLTLLAAAELIDRKVVSAPNYDMHRCCA
ncbi:MAG: hypothetical protein RMK18_02200 [Armatimonadota bacterium]|nr:hypothetical protein [Armatimonadota bacterium]MCX7777254.1 hypothetical protein [Armatimonadota bacterium]MDW8024669.1 hypothetical protein [Armatimonadota bacterium]